MPTPGGPPVVKLKSTSALAGLTWTDEGGGLGRLYNGSTPTYIWAGYDSAVGAVAWFFGTTLPTGCIESQVTETVATALQTGDVTVDGQIVYNSHTYGVVQYWNGSLMTAILQ